MDQKIAVQIFDEHPASRIRISSILKTTDFFPVYHPTFTSINYDDTSNSSCCCMFRVKSKISDIDDILKHSLSRNSKYVILYSERPEVIHVVYAMRNGAFDFLNLPFKENELIASLANVTEHKRNEFEKIEFRCSVASKLTRLTLREHSILEQIISGNRNKVIAYNLGISQRTVENHRLHMMAKMEARSIAHLIKMLSALSKI